MLLAIAFFSLFWRSHKLFSYVLVKPRKDNFGNIIPFTLSPPRFARLSIILTLQHPKGLKYASRAHSYNECNMLHIITLF